MIAGTGQLLRAALLLGFAGLIGKLFLAGEMIKYMSPTLDPLSALAGIVLAAMGVMALRGDSQHPLEHHRFREASDVMDGPGHAQESTGIERVLTYLLVLLPLILGLVITPRALGSSALGGQNVANLVLAFAPPSAPWPGAPPPAPLGSITDTPNLLAYLRQSGESGVGQPVRATGLVARSEALTGNEFVLLRYAIVHCVADARPVALLVVAPEDPGVRSDQWVAVEGVLAARERDGDRLVTIEARRILPVEEPQNPYLQPW